MSSFLEEFDLFGDNNGVDVMTKAAEDAAVVVAPPPKVKEEEKQEETPPSTPSEAEESESDSNEKEEEKGASSKSQNSKAPEVTINDLSKIGEAVAQVKKDEKGSTPKMSRKARKAKERAEREAAKAAARQQNVQSKKEVKAPEEKTEEPSKKTSAPAAKRVNHHSGPQYRMKNLEYIKELSRRAPKAVYTGIVSSAKYKSVRGQNDSERTRVPVEWKLSVTNKERTFFVILKREALQQGVYPVPGSVVSFQLNHNYGACDVEQISMKNAATSLCDVLFGQMKLSNVRVVSMNDVLERLSLFTTEIANNADTDTLIDLVTAEFGEIVGRTNNGQLIIATATTTTADDDDDNDDDDNNGTVNGTRS